MKEITRQGRADVIELADAAGIGRVADAAVNYNWLCRASTHALPRRIQALAAAPVLLPILLQVGNTAEQRVGDVDSDVDVDVDSPLLRAELDRVVDGGEPLFAWLASACGVSERTVRHLRTSALRQHTFKPLLLLSSTNSWRDFAERCLGYLTWLDTLPVERWPQTARQWRTLAELMSAAERTFDASRVFAACFNTRVAAQDTGVGGGAGVVAAFTSGE